MKIVYIIPLLFLAACSGAENPSNDAPEKQDTSTQVNAGQSIGDSTIQPVDSVYIDPKKINGGRPKGKIVFTPPVVVEEEPKEDLVIERELIGPENVASDMNDIGPPPAGEPIMERPVSEDQIFEFAQELPSFKGNLQKYISDKLVYPPAAVEANIQGTVWIRIVVTRDGSVTNAEVAKGFRGTIGEEINQEALRVIKEMPSGSWNPSTNNGKPVNCRFSVPVKFVIE